MIKLLKYELKRLLLNKLFLGLMAITCLYSYQTLSGVTILGVAGTAPFSPWSYGSFLATVLPLMLITLLFFVTFLYSKKEKRVQTLTGATPIDPLRYGLLRCCAMAAGFMILSVLVIGISLFFYSSVFHFTGFGVFLLPIAMTLIPVFLFCMGLGLIAGKLHAGLIYPLMLLFLLLGQVSLPGGIDLLGSHFFGSHPLSLAIDVTGEPAFVVPAVIWVGKLCFVAVGLFMIVLGLKTPRVATARLRTKATAN